MARRLSITLGTPEPLEFDAATHTYRIGGERVPGVTSVLEPWAGRVDPWTGAVLCPQDVWDRAGERGTIVHAACHLWNQDALEWESLDDEVAGYVRGWVSFLETTGALVLASERRVVSRRHWYAGTLDARVEWGRMRPLVDIKATAGWPSTVGPQTAAYAEAYTEETGERIRDRYCVRLLPDGTFRIRKLEDPSDFNVFKAALVLHQWTRAAYYSNDNPEALDP